MTSTATRMLATNQPITERDAFNSSTSYQDYLKRMMLSTMFTLLQILA